MVIRMAGMTVTAETHIGNFSKLHNLPTLWDLTQGGIDEAGFFVTGEVEVDEPIAVEVLGHFFKNLNPPQVVFNQIVVG